MWEPIFGRGRKQPYETRGPDITIPFFGAKSHLSIDRRWRFIRSVGIDGAKTKIGLANILHDINRLMILRRAASA